MRSLGDYINGTFVEAIGEKLLSINPSNQKTVVALEWDPEHVELACRAAKDASKAWLDLELEGRFEVMLRFRDALIRNKEVLADAIVREIGKIRSEARVEISALINRIELVKRQIDRDFREGELQGFPGESQRYRPHGVVGVIGPYNFPLHLCHAHAVPALLMGNSVVIKPSELAPYCGQLYAAAAHEAGFPPGVFNMVNGLGRAGAALTANKHVRGICFTGSYPTGRRILDATIDRPEVLVALEMGGKNTAIVLPDADLRQAAHEITIGGYLTTGQRCTCTDRVLVHEDVREEFIEALASTVKQIQFGDPDDKNAFAGPIVSEYEWKRYNSTILKAESEGAKVILPHKTFGPGYFATPSLHDCGHVSNAFPGYTDDEVFGPNLSLQTFNSLDEAIQTLNRSHFGFANAVFTRDLDAFERLYAEAHAGIWNQNRRTNQASPRLPFGGVGQSGNYRPAGAYAARNVCYPVAMQNSMAGNITLHPKLKGRLPSPNLDQLEKIHLEEETKEQLRDLLETPRPNNVILPKEGILPQSQFFLERLYAGNRVPRQKSKLVCDHLRSNGPFFVSNDQNPLAILDANPNVTPFNDHFAVSAFIDGRFNNLFLQTDSEIQRDFAFEFEVKLRKIIDLSEITFTNSGSLAIEKALLLCQTQNHATHLLAFEGSDLGNTLFEKQNPISVAPFPVWKTPMEEDPKIPNEFFASLEQLGAEKGLQRFKGKETLLDGEIDSLIKVEHLLTKTPHFAVIIEPMQHLGNRYASPRFFAALHCLVFRFKIPLIMNEIHTGFGATGSFFLHELFKISAQEDMEPEKLAPEVIVFGGHAQIGVVCSNFSDSAASEVDPTSLVRSLIHLDQMDKTVLFAKKMQFMVWQRLKIIKQSYPHLVSNPRGRGFIFAFDLPSSKEVTQFNNQALWRGAFFGNEHNNNTVRLRLHLAFSEKHLVRLFEAIRRSLSWIDAHPNSETSNWENNASSNAPLLTAAITPENYRIREIVGKNGEILHKIMEMEKEIYEPARIDTIDRFLPAFEEDGIVLIAEKQELDPEKQWTFVGSSLAFPLEHVQDLEGPNEDPLTKRANTLFAFATTIASKHRKKGLGKALKSKMISLARKRRIQHPYLYITGRNHLEPANGMERINEQFGGHTRKIYHTRFGKRTTSSYYRMPIRAISPCSLQEKTLSILNPGNVSQGIRQPLAQVPKSLLQLAKNGGLTGPTVSKLSLQNYITPAAVRAIEWIGTLLPDLPHMYFTSSRDENVDKMLELLRHHNPNASIAIGLEGGYVGHTTKAARSLSDPNVLPETIREKRFDWPKIPHPAEVGSEITLNALKKSIENVGKNNIAALFIEPIQEKTGRVIPDDFWKLLKENITIPVIFVENASNAYRSGKGPFACTSISFSPDAVIWWGGGQTGFIHTSTPLFVGKSQLFASENVDELSMIRVSHQLRAIRKLDLTKSILTLNLIAEKYREKGISSYGQGLYRVFFPGKFANQLDLAWKKAGLFTKAFANGGRLFAPYLDRAEEALAKLDSSKIF